jgi:hypothetical protein
MKFLRKFRYNRPCNKNIVPEYIPKEINIPEMYLLDSKMETDSTIIEIERNPSRVNGCIHLIPPKIKQ